MNVDQGLQVVPGEVVLALPRWRIVLSAAVWPVLLIAGLAYGVSVAVSTYSWVVLTLAFIVALVKVPYAVVTAVVRLTGPAAALTTDGIRVRPRPWRRALLEVPWSRATMLWIDYVGRQPFLNVVPSGQFGRRSRRPDSAVRPFVIALPPSAGPAVVRAAVRNLSDGTADVLDRGFDHDARMSSGSDVARRWRRGRETPPPWWRSAVQAVAVVCVFLLGVPVVVGGPPPWNHSWWPGTTVTVGLPDPCDALTATSGTEVGGLPGTSTRSWGDRECRVEARTAVLTVAYRVHHPFLGNSVAAAVDDAAEARYQADTDTPLPGVGDEAWIGSASYGSGRSAAGLHVVARRANVVVEVRFLSRDDEEAVRNLVTGTARAALDQLSVR